MDIVKVTIALMVLVNPLGAVPLFISLTPDAGPTERRAIAKTAALTVAIVIGVSALLGQALLQFLGIRIGAFQVGGGLLIMLIAIALMNAQPAPTKTTAAERAEAEGRSSIAVVPLAIPLLTGPGTISTVIIYASTAQTTLQLGSIVAAGCVVALACFASMSLATPISRLLGQTGINIVNRVMGMLLAAVSVEIIVDGLTRLFPQLAN